MKKNIVELPSIKDVSHSYRKIQGQTIHIAEVGNGKPLILLHG